MVDRSDHQVALFHDVFRAEDDVLRFPERLRFDKVDAVFCFVAFAFPRIELEFHNADLTNAPASRASRAAPMRVHALYPKQPASSTMHRKRLTMDRKLSSFRRTAPSASLGTGSTKSPRRLLPNIRNLHALFFARVIGGNA